MSLAVYLIEAGLVLAAAPWTEWWERNYFAGRWPWLVSWMNLTGIHILVVSVGVATTVAGMVELRGALGARPNGQSPPDSHVRQDRPDPLRQ